MGWNSVFVRLYCGCLSLRVIEYGLEIGLIVIN